MAGKKRGNNKKRKDKLDVRWLIIPFVLILLLILALFFLFPQLIQGNAVFNGSPSGGASPVSNAPNSGNVLPPAGTVSSPIAPGTYIPSNSGALVNETKTVSVGQPTTIAGLPFVLTNLPNKVSAGDPSFATFLAGADVVNSTGSSISLNLDGRAYTLKIVSVSGKNVSLMLSSPTVSDSENIKENSFGQFNFPNPTNLHVGDYFLVGNGTNEPVYKILFAQYMYSYNAPYYECYGNISLSYTCAIASVTDVTTNKNYNVTWSGYLVGYGTLKNPIGGGYVQDYYGNLYNLFVEGGPEIGKSSYNLTIEQYVYFPQYPFASSRNVIYSRPNLPSVFVRNASSASAVSLIPGYEMFLNTANNTKTIVLISGKTYTIQLLSTTSNTATFSVTSGTAASTSCVKLNYNGCAFNGNTQSNCCDANVRCMQNGVAPSVARTSQPIYGCIACYPAGRFLTNTAQAPLCCSGKTKGVSFFFGRLFQCA